MQITYQKKDGCIIKRFRNSILPYKIGEETSMGWKVLSIEYEYNNKYYPEYEYYMLIHKNKQRCIKSKQLKEIYMNELKTFMYYFIALLILNCLKFILHI